MHNFKFCASLYICTKLQNFPYYYAIYHYFHLLLHDSNSVSWGRRSSPMMVYVIVVMYYAYSHSNLVIITN